MSPLTARIPKLRIHCFGNSPVPFRNQLLCGGANPYDSLSQSVHKRINLLIGLIHSVISTFLRKIPASQMPKPFQTIHLASFKLEVIEHCLPHLAAGGWQRLLSHTRLRHQPPDQLRRVVTSSSPFALLPVNSRAFPLFSSTKTHPSKQPNPTRLDPSKV